MLQGKYAHGFRTAALVCLAWTLAGAAAQAQQFSQSQGPACASCAGDSGMPTSAGCASCGSCGFMNSIATSLGMKCCRVNCPPAYHHCSESPPCIKFHHGCPKPICSPCALPHFGYNQTCWSPYPYGPDWSHCPTPPPAALVHLNSPPSNVFGSAPYGGASSAPPGLQGVPATGDRTPPTLPTPRTYGSGR